MVPFAEVILLTAMEYNRDEKERGKKTKRKRGRKAKKLQWTSSTIDPMDKNTIVEKIKTARFCLNSLLPSLKTLGEIFFFNSK